MLSSRKQVYNIQPPTPLLRKQMYNIESSDQCHHSEGKCTTQLLMPSLRWQVYNKGVSALPSLRTQQRAIQLKASIQHSNQRHHSEGRCTGQSQHCRHLASVQHRSINAAIHKASVQDYTTKSLLSPRKQVHNTDLSMPSLTRQVYKTSRQIHHSCHLEPKCTTQIYQGGHP